jgi:hypothetical protein
VAITEDMTGGDPGAVFGFPSPGESVIVITIMDDEGTIIVPSFMYPNAGQTAAARQSVASFGPAWFIVRTAENTATVFDEDGSVIADVGDYIVGAPHPAGIVALATGGAERAITATADTAFIATSGTDEHGYPHPCVIRIDVDSASGTAAVTQVIQADDDLAAGDGFVGPAAMDLDAWGAGYLMVVWKQGPNQSPVARYFNTDGQPMSASFWVSTKGSSDTNTGDATIKCCAGRLFSAVAWLSESFEPGNNCVGNPMERDTVVRFFEPPWTPLAVEEWAEY